MGVRSLGAASSASSSSSASQSGVRSRRAGETKRSKNKPRQLRRTVFQNSSFFDRPRTSEFSFFKSFQKCLPEVHTPERDDRTIDSGSHKNDYPRYNGDHEDDGNTGSHEDDGEFYIGRSRSKENLDLNFMSDATPTGNHNDGDYKNIFTRIQHHLRELSSRSSKTAGLPSVATLMRRLEVVSPAIPCEQNCIKDMDRRWSPELSDVTGMNADWKDWNIKEMTALAWSSGLSDDNNGDWRGHVKSHSQLEDDDGESQYEALKNWNIKEMTRSAWSTGRLPNVNDSQLEGDDDSDEEEIRQHDSISFKPEEEELDFELAKNPFGRHLQVRNEAGPAITRWSCDWNEEDVKFVSPATSFWSFDVPVVPVEDSVLAEARANLLEVEESEEQA